jgi:DNA gyrase subunit A
LIRVPGDQVRVTGRQAMGVTLFRVDSGEHVTSVFPVLEDESDDGDGPGTVQGDTAIVDEATPGDIPDEGSDPEAKPGPEDEDPKDINDA